MPFQKRKRHLDAGLLLKERDGFFFIDKLSGIFSIPDFLFVASQKANVFESGNAKKPCTAIVCQS